MSVQLWETKSVGIKLYTIGAWIPGIKPDAPRIEDTPCECIGNLAVHGEGCITHIPTSVLLAEVETREQAKELVEAVAHLDWGNFLQHASIVALHQAVAAGKGGHND